jgi:hypothetical protein
VLAQRVAHQRSKIVAHRCGQTLVFADHREVPVQIAVNGEFDVSEQGIECGVDLLPSIGLRFRPGATEVLLQSGEQLVAGCSVRRAGVDPGDHAAGAGLQ